MMKLIVYLIVFVFVITRCNNGNVASTQNDSVNQPAVKLDKVSFLGTWNVLSITESTFDMNDGELLKGPFSDSRPNTTISFQKDSIKYVEGSRKQSTYFESTYTYSSINDSMLNVKNISSGDTMKFVIQHLNANVLKFKNIRLEERRGNRYEVTIECSKQ